MPSMHCKQLAYQASMFDKKKSSHTKRVCKTLSQVSLTTVSDELRALCCWLAQEGWVPYRASIPQNALPFQRS